MAILIFEHSDRFGAGRLGRTLRDYGHRLRIIRLHRGEAFPADLDDVDGLISCGGPQSANDDSIEWIAPQMDLLRAAHESQMPVIGLGLGSQVVARALGGMVEPLEGAPEIGWCEVRLSPIGREDSIFTGIAWQSMQPVWHREHVVSMPEGARLLASSDRCRVQAWALGLRTYAFQYHPEIDAEALQALAADDPLTQEALREQTERHFSAFERLSQRLFESVALFLMPVDRRYRGLVKDLHH